MAIQAMRVWRKGAAKIEDIGLNFGLDLLERFIGQKPDVVLDRAIIGLRAGVGDQVQLAVVPAAIAAHDDAGQQRVKSGRQ